jgi:hypothetical protein
LFNLRFDFNNLHYIEGNIRQQANCSIIKLMPYQIFSPLRRHKANVPFLKSKQFELIGQHNAEQITKIILPETKLKETNKEKH